MISSQLLPMLMNGVPRLSFTGVVDASVIVSEIVNLSGRSTNINLPARSTNVTLSGRSTNAVLADR